MSPAIRAARPALAALLLATGAAHALQTVNVPQLNLRTNETYAHELVAFAAKADIQGVVQDDLFLAGETLSLGGRYASDVWAFGGERVTFTGRAEDHARLAGRVVLVEGEVARGTWLVGETVRIAPGARLKGDVSVLAQDFICLGTIEGRLSATSPKMTLGGRVGGDAEIVAEDLVVQSGAQFGSNLFYSASERLRLDRKEQVAGELIRRDQPAGAAAGTLWIARGFLFLGSYAVGLLFLLLFPGMAGGAARRMRTGWWRPMLAGSLVFAAGPFVAAMAFASLVGIPIALALTAGGGLMLLLAPVGPAIALGGFLGGLRGPQPAGAAVRAYTIGLVAIHLLAALPGAFLPVFLVVTMLGGGAVLLAAFAAGRPPPMATPVVSITLPPALPPMAGPPGP